MLASAAGEGQQPDNWADTRSGVEGMAASLGMPGYDDWCDARAGQGLRRAFADYEAAVHALLAERQGGVGMTVRTSSARRRPSRCA